MALRCIRLGIAADDYRLTSSAWQWKSAAWRKGFDEVMQVHETGAIELDQVYAAMAFVEIVTEGRRTISGFSSKGDSYV